MVSYCTLCESLVRAVNNKSNPINIISCLEEIIVNCQELTKDSCVINSCICSSKLMLVVVTCH